MTYIRFIMIQSTGKLLIDHLAAMTVVLTLDKG